MFFVFLIILFIVLLITFLKYRNKVLLLKDRINQTKSRVRVAKAKYLQVLKKVEVFQKNSLNSQSEAYKNAIVEGVGVAVGGAVGKIDDSLQSSSEIIEQLANNYAEAQNELNRIINLYNKEILVFPKTIYAAILGYKREQYIDEENIDKSMVIKEFEDDI